MKSINEIESKQNNKYLQLIEEHNSVASELFAGFFRLTEKFIGTRCLATSVSIACGFKLNRLR